jgi:hypothetical protein
MIRRDPAILEQPISTRKTLGECITPRLQIFLKKLEELTLSELKSLKNHTDQEDKKKEYVRHVILLINASALSAIKKKFLLHDCSDNSEVLSLNRGFLFNTMNIPQICCITNILKRELFLLGEKGPLDYTEIPNPSKNKAISAANLFKGGLVGRHEKYHEFHHLIQSQCLLLNEPVSADKTLAEYIAPNLHHFLNWLDEIQNILWNLDHSKFTCEAQDSYFNDVLLFVNQSSLPLEHKIDLLNFCAEGKAANYRPPFAGPANFMGFFSNTTPTLRKQFLMELEKLLPTAAGVLFSQRRDEENLVRCAREDYFP